MIKLCLIGDYLLTRNAYIKAFSSFEDFGVLGDFDKLVDCVEFLEHNSVDVILIYANGNGFDDLESIRYFKEKYKQTKIIVIADSQEQTQILKVLSDGANGYVLKNISIDALVKIIRDAFDGNLIVSAGAVDVLTAIFQEKIRHSQTPMEFQLTKREKEILDRISKGQSNSEIGRELCLSAFTIKNYVSKIIEKLGVKDRTQATARAVQYGLISS